MIPVSVLMPIFDGAEVVTQAVNNVLGQTVRPAEIVIADDGSRDGLGDRLQTLRERCAQAGIALVCTGFSENRGRGAARNLALLAASRELVSWYDVDDLWDSAKLARQYNAFGNIQLEHPENRVLLTCNYYRYDDHVEPKLVTVPPTITIEDIVSVHRRRHVQLQTVFGPRAAFLRAGMFDETLNRAEDFDLTLRYAAAGGKFVNPDPDGRPLIHYFRSPLNGGEEAAAANRRAVEKSRLLFRANHVEAEAFLNSKLTALRRTQKPPDAPSSGRPPWPSKNGCSAGPVDRSPNLAILADGSLTISPGTEGTFIARAADLREVGRGAFRGTPSENASLTHAEIVALFMDGARILDFTTRRGPTVEAGQLRVLRAPSGLIRIGVECGNPRVNCPLEDPSMTPSACA